MSASNPLEPSPGETRNDPRPLLIILIVLCSFFVITYALRLDERDRVEAAIVAQTSTNEVARARGAELREMLDKVRKPAYLDGIIRGLLGMGKPGDTRLVPVDAPNLAQFVAPSQPAAPVAHELPIWRQWLDLFSVPPPPQPALSDPAQVAPAGP